MTQKKSILIVDDHPLFREGLKAIIARDARYEVVGEAGNGREALKMARELNPDLILLDMALPDQNGIELTGKIRDFSSEIHIMIVSMHSKIDYIVKAFQAGATGYVVKESASDRLLQGIEWVLNGEYFLDSSVSHMVVTKLMQSPEKKTTTSDAGYAALTSREQEVLVHLAQGLSPKEIADNLFISPKTVENHRANILSKLGLHTTLELVRYAAKLGLIDVDLWKG
jgi:DNA-binding NarL/FixJ family response regulator